MTLATPRQPRNTAIPDATGTWAPMASPASDGNVITGLRRIQHRQHRARRIHRPPGVRRHTHAHTQLIYGTRLSQSRLAPRARRRLPQSSIATREHFSDRHEPSRAPQSCASQSASVPDRTCFGRTRRECPSAGQGVRRAAVRWQRRLWGPATTSRLYRLARSRSVGQGRRMPASRTGQRGCRRRSEPTDLT